MADKENTRLNDRLVEINTVMDQAIKQIELVLRSGQVSELASVHLRQACDELKGAMIDD